MKYPTMFITKVMTVRSFDNNLRQLLNDGLDEPVGKYLWILCRFDIPAERFLDELKMPYGCQTRQIAYERLKWRELYAEWRRLYTKEWRKAKRTK